MKSLFMMLLFLLPISEIEATDKKELVEFVTKEMDLGEIPIKDSKELMFYYTNKSTKPLVILGAKTSCGCTKVKYNRKPLPANAKDSIKVIFTPNDRGVFYKKTTISTSVGERHTLILKGSVK